MRQSTGDIMLGGSEPRTWWPRFGPADDIPTARQPSYHLGCLNTAQDIEMSIAVPYHAWFVGHQTECIGSSLPNSECLYWSQGRTRRRSEQLRRQREDALLVERLDNPTAATCSRAAAPDDRAQDHADCRRGFPGRRREAELSCAARSLTRCS